MDLYWLYFLNKYILYIFPGNFKLHHHSNENNRNNSHETEKKAKIQL